MSGKYQKSLNREMARITRILKRHYRPEKIMVYGSMAKGKIHKWSDLDLMIVKKTNKCFYDRIGEVLQLTKPRQAVDFLIYTPNELQDMETYSYFIRDEIIKKGKVIYEKNA